MTLAGRTPSLPCPVSGILGHGRLWSPASESCFLTWAQEKARRERRALLQKFRRHTTGLWRLERNRQASSGHIPIAHEDRLRTPHCSRVRALPESLIVLSVSQRPLLTIAMAADAPEKETPMQRMSTLICILTVLMGLGMSAFAATAGEPDAAISSGVLGTVIALEPTRRA